MTTFSGTPALEDSWYDILGKAIRGSGVEEKNLAASANIIPAKLKTILQGEIPSEDTLRRLAIAVGISPSAFLEIASGKYYPKPFNSSHWVGVHQISSQYMDYRVNCYIIFDQTTREAILFDTGTELGPIENIVREYSLKLSAVYITHSHGDHVAILDEVVQKFGCKVYAPKGEPVSGSLEVAEGHVFSIGSIKGSTKLTDGHSVGHLTYVLSSSQWTAPVAVVGDAIFAGSMGGGMVSYSRLKRNVQDKILTLPAETLLCPGHGPMSTVAEENAHNPFA